MSADGSGKAEVDGCCEEARCDREHYEVPNRVSPNAMILSYVLGMDCTVRRHRC